MFLVALAAATVLPFYSELLFAGMLLKDYNPWLLWAAATAGNTAGSVVNWALARFFLHFEDRRWFPFKRERLHRAQRWFNRYGTWSLLMAWAPVGGDALTFVGGLMNVRLWLFTLLVGIGKGARYAVLLWLTLF